jgi:hypothetical protein
MELKEPMGHAGRTQQDFKNPFNGIERQIEMLKEYLEGQVKQNPFNGIESTVGDLHPHVETPAVGIHSMELKDTGAGAGHSCAHEHRIHSMELKVSG